MVELPKGVHKVRARGRTYYYAWRGGPRIEAEPGTTDFFDEIARHKNPLTGLDRRKFSAWITLYRASDDFRGLAEQTRRVWAPWFDHIRDEFGELRTLHFDRPAIRKLIKAWRNRWKETPRAADMGKQVLSRILSFAVEEGALMSNPCLGLSNLYSANRAEIIWTAEDLETLRAHASKEIYDAAQLAALTGLRQGDLLKLTWSHVKGNVIEIKTGKSRERRTASVPITSRLRAALDAIPRRSTSVLTNTEGRPWRGGFGMSWNKVMHRSGLNTKGLHFHDLRGTAATNLFRAGLTMREISTIMAWSDDKVERLIDRYVKKDEIILDRIRRLDAAETGFTSGKKA